jgi:hypothetical protein
MMGLESVEPNHALWNRANVPIVINIARARFSVRMEPLAVPFERKTL